MAVQIALGADVMMVFDECVEHPASYERTRESMGLTHAWAGRSAEYFAAHCEEVPWFEEFGGRTQSLFGIVQGGMYADLRRESAERLVEMDLPGYAIGGLAVGEPREVTREMIARTLEFLPKDKPRYVMGVGYPDEIEEYARMGVDMMDCVLPTRAGRHGLVFTRVEGIGAAAGGIVRMNIKKAEFAEDRGPIDAGCGCGVCARYSRGYLRHLFASGEPLAGTLLSVHNLAFYLDTMARVRAELAA
jgi:queuine tRNA-ribosyltransferase